MTRTTYRDANGNRLTHRKRDGRTLTFAHDAMDRMTSKVVPDGCAPIQVGTCTPSTATRDVYYTYDLHGRQLTAKFDSSGGADGLTSVYDLFGNLTSSTIAMAGFSKTLNAQYDVVNRRTRLTHPDGAFFDYSYDPADRMSGASENGSTSLFTQAFTPFGDRASMTRGGASSAFGYDGSSRITSIAHDLASTNRDVTWTFGYNVASQLGTNTRDNDAYAWTAHVAGEKAYAVNGLNQYTTVAATAHTYDANGNLTADGTNTFVYDAENRLVSATSGGVTTTLTWDPMGRLWQLVKGTLNTRFLYDGDELVGEYDSGGTLLRRYVHGAGVDDPMIWYEGSSLASSGRRQLFADRQGSVVAVADSAGTAIGVNAYDEYGIPAAANIGRFQYTGQIWLSEIGLYHYKARLYSPTLGRFLQTDPIGYDDQINLYAYVGNDPMNAIDPSGTYECQGDKSQCGAVAAAYNQATKALASNDLTKAEKTKLESSLGALGAPGQKNGVTVSFASQKEISAKVGNGFAYTEKTKTGISVVLPKSFAKSFNDWKKSNPASPVASRIGRFSPEHARANALAHEGKHVDQFKRGLTQKQYESNPTPYEVDAYRTGNLVNNAFNTISPMAEP